MKKFIIGLHCEKCRKEIAEEFEAVQLAVVIASLHHAKVARARECSGAARVAIQHAEYAL